MTDQTQGIDSLGSKSATYTVKWHYAGENWAPNGPNFFTTSSIMDWQITKSVVTPQPIITTGTALEITYGKGKPYVEYGGTVLSLAAIVIGALANYVQPWTIPAALVTLVGMLAGSVNPQGTSVTISWGQVENLPPGYINLPEQERALHPLEVSILPEDVCAPWKGDGYDSDGYTGALFAKVVVLTHFHARYVKDYQGSY